jgi:hypothetical protein
VSYCQPGAPQRGTERLLDTTGIPRRVILVRDADGAAVGLSIVALTSYRLNATGVALAYLAGTAVTASGPIAIFWRRYRMTWLGPVARLAAVVASAFVGARALGAWQSAAGPSWPVSVLGALVATAGTLLLLQTPIRRVLAAAGANCTLPPSGATAEVARPAELLGRAKRGP